MTAPATNYAVPKIGLNDPLVEKLGVQYTHRPALTGKVYPVAYSNDRTPMAAQYWRQQLTRCKYGWTCPHDGVFDVAPYYFNLNFLKYVIEDPETGKSGLESPWVIDADRDLYSTFYHALSHNKEIGGKMRFKPARGKVFAKGRRARFTSACWGFSMWHFVTRHGRNIGYLYPDEDTKDRENARIRRMYALLHDQFKFDKDGNKLELIVQNKDVLTQGYYKGEGANRVAVTVNSWYFAVASAVNPGVFRGEQMGLIIIAEAGKWKHLKAVMRAQVECLREGKYYYGLMIIGGTSETIINGTVDYKEAFYEANKFDMDAVFLPPTRGRKGHYDLKTGKSNEESALAEILALYETASQSSNPNDLLSIKQEFPLKPADCFIPPTANDYDKNRLDEQDAYLQRSVRAEDFLYGRLTEETTWKGNSTGRIVLEEVPNGQSIAGLWKVLRSAITDPEHNRFGDEKQFVIGFDDFAKNIHASEKKKWHSDGALVVIDVDTRQIVAAYVHRPTRPIMHEQAVLALRYWPGMMNYEYNDDTFYEVLEKHSMLDRVIYWGDKGWGPRDKPGMHPQGTIAEQTAHMNQSIMRGDYKKWMFAEAIDSLRKWQSVNTDFGSAHHLANIGLSRMNMISKPKEEQQRWQPLVQFGSAVGQQFGGLGSFGSMAGGNAAFLKFGSRD